MGDDDSDTELIFLDIPSRKLSYFTKSLDKLKESLRENCSSKQVN